ncbi:hypothetical protein QQ020_34490 [Fulvivirgaceae bacterium BMA12]|uniref:Uncharacterized protein n=1 Tax=Agaribacillus aureus TaxID=3051825 RepID=A0ABT8LLN4_9BACT|nr:hypothetical protein [Fulvivirgaceae bacterium BMA12]
MKDLQNYTTVLRDVGLDSTPERDESGLYHWSDGQLEILTQKEFNDLRINQGKIDRTNASLKALSEEILAFEAPTQALEQEGNGLLGGNEDEIRDQQAQLDQYKASLAQLDKDMLLRGHIPPNEAPPPEAPVAPPKKRNRVTGREILGFLLIWVIGEVFMTYVQWQSLRDGRGIEDLIVRSISLGVVLFLIHLVGRFFKRDRRPVHMVFLGFSFLMLFTMLLGPLLLNEAYPPIDGNADVAAQWSLQEEPATTPAETVSPYPFWVNFYRKNDMLPGIFVFLFFVIMQTFPKSKPKEIEPVLPQLEPESGKNQIEERRQYYQQQIKQIENQLKELKEIQANAIAPNTKQLHSILDELQAKQSEVMALKREKDHLLMENDHLLRKLEMHLKRYQTEYLNVLKNDQVKALVVQPVWPTMQDLKTYFNLS